MAAERRRPGGAGERPPTDDGGTAPDEHTQAQPQQNKKEGRLTRHARHARMVWDDPRSLGAIVRDGLIRIWSSRGGGFFGLGYLVTFVILEVRLIVTEFEGSSGVLDFISSQLLEYLFRLGIMSFVNVLLAFLWPVLLLEHLGGWGLVILPLAYLAFEHGLRPGVEAAVPELAEARRLKRQRKEEKQRRKQER